jgi:hypothetical protein
MLLQEIFDTKVPYHVTTNTDNKWVAKGEINGRTIEFEAEKHFHANNWKFFFSEFKDGGKAQMSRTGSGGELKVLSMVKACMNEVIELHKPEKIFFDAHKDKPGEDRESENRDASRGNVYERLVKTFKDQYTYTRVSKRIRDQFQMVRITNANT